MADELAASRADNVALRLSLRDAQEEARSVRQSSEQSCLALKAQLEEARAQLVEAQRTVDSLSDELWEVQTALDEKDVELLQANEAREHVNWLHQASEASLRVELDEHMGELELLRQASEAAVTDRLRLEGASARSEQALEDLRGELARMSGELEDKAVLEASLVHAECCADAMRAELHAIMHVSYASTAICLA